MRVAALQDGRLLDFSLTRPGAPDWVGAVFRGRITARMPALAGAFVALGEAGDGFLPDSAGGKGVGEGTVLAVRVVRATQGGKGVRLARVGVPTGSGAAGLLSPGLDSLERLALLHPAAPIAADDAAVLATHPDLRPRITIVSQAFDAETEAQVEALAAPRVSLPGSGAMTIEPTSALVAIDFDLGRRSGDRAAKTAAHEAANAAFVAELGRAIRLRNLGGAIVVDFAGLSPRRRAALGPTLAAALARDPLGPRFLGFTALGLAEIVRPRVHPPLHEVLGTPHAAGLAALRALAREVAANPAHSPALTLAPDVAAALAADSVALREAAARFGRPPRLETDRASPPGRWWIAG